MSSKLFRFFARIAAGLLILHLFFFWAAERGGTFMGFAPAHFKDSAVLFFLIAVYLLLESHFSTREREVVEEEIVSITEESMPSAMISAKREAWKNPYIASAAVVGVALIIAGAIISGSRKPSQVAAQNPTISQVPTQPQQPPPQAPAQKIPVSWGTTPILNKNAKVSFIEFGDFQCPFCGSFYTNSFLQIKQKYIDTGKIAYQHRDYPLPFHPFAEKAAEAARCALEQSEKQYWAISDWMYKNQTTLEVTTLKNTAKTLGINAAKFDSCLDSGKYAAAVKTDADAGAQYGVSGTPSFFLNGELIVGAQPYATFEQKIEGALNGK